MKILVALDTSAASQAALEEIAQRPWPAGSSFNVLSVVEPSHLWSTPESLQEAVRRAREVVERAVEQLHSANLTASGVAVDGDPKTVILDEAQGSSADFVVVASHGTSGVARLLLGSVAGAVLRYAPCSVEVVRARPKAKSAGPARILLAVDGSEYSIRAARSIAARPWRTGAEIRVLNVVELRIPTTRVLFEPPFVDSAIFESLREEAMKHSQNAIAEAMEILTPTGLTVSDSLSVLVEPPKEIILKEAEDWGADLIVLGSHGRQGVNRFLMGSVSEAVAMHAGCSVEVIRKDA